MKSERSKRHKNMEFALLNGILNKFLEKSEQRGELGLRHASSYSFKRPATLS